MAEGYPIDAQKALWKQYNEVVQLLLSEFKGGKYDDIKEFRKAVFWDLLQNHDLDYQTHADVLTTTVFSNIEQRRFNVLNLDTVVEYLNQSFEAWKFFKPNPLKISYTPIHTSASNINSFVKRTLIPFVKVLNGTVDANIEIPSDFGIDGTPEQQKAVNKLYKDLRKFAKDNPNIKLAKVKSRFFQNQVKFKQNPDLQGASYDLLFSELIDEFHDFEFQAMFSVVPGTEGIRPALNVATSVYESIDDVWETLDDVTKTDLADLFDLLEIDPNTSTVQKFNYAPEDYKLFIKDKITEFLTQFSNNANQYLEGTEGFVEASPVFDKTYTERGSGIRRVFREVFKGEFLETNRYPIDVLLNKSPDPIGLLQAIDDAHRAMNVNAYNPPYVGEPVINKIQEIAGLKTDGVQSVGGFLGMKFAGMTVPEVAAEIFDFPQRPDAVDIKPMMDRLNVADTVLVEKNGTVTGTFTEVSDTTPIPLGDDIARGLANDFYVVTPEQLSNAIEEIRKSFGDTLPEIQFESHLDFINQLEQTLMTQGFQEKVGGELDDLRTVIDDWLTNQSTFEDTKFFNDFPKLENLPDPQNVRGLVAAAGGPENIREGYVQPQYFKDKPNVPYVVEDIIDTPTNVVDDIIDTPTNVVDDVKTLDIENYKPITIEVLDAAGLHARPANELIAILNKQNIPLVILEDGNLKEIGMVGLLKQQKLKGETLDIYIPTDAELNLDNVEGIKVAPTPTNVVDDLETAIARTDGIDALNKSKDIINKNPRIFGKILNVLEKLDVGDQVIQQVIKRALPRIGLGAVAGPIGIAYAVYETSLLLADAASAAYKSETTDEGFWENFGEISDKYSIAYKITKPTYELLLDAVKADLEDNNTLYSFSR